ncbi:MAG: hypothetical protein IT371_05760 [Deltaproteobacteria bacterium]|nr:hypothetical protein [Deltaproteobacteria bacterium]
MSTSRCLHSRGAFVAAAVMIVALGCASRAFARGAHGEERRNQSPAEALKERIFSAKIDLIGHAGQGRAAVKAYSLRVFAGLVGLELKAGVAHVITDQGKLQKKVFVGAKGLAGVGFGVLGAKEQLKSPGSTKSRDGFPVVEYGGGLGLAMGRGVATGNTQVDWRSPGGIEPMVEGYGLMAAAFVSGGLNLKVPVSRQREVPHLLQGEALLGQAEAALRAGNLARAGELVGQVEQAVNTARQFFEAPLK